MHRTAASVVGKLFLKRKVHCKIGCDKEGWDPPRDLGTKDKQRHGGQSPERIWVQKKKWGAAKAPRTLGTLTDRMGWGGGSCNEIRACTKIGWGGGFSEAPLGLERQQ